jgi:hypothetical protein
VSNVTIIIIQIQQDGKKASVADFGVANQNWPTRTEEQHEKAQSGYSSHQLEISTQDFLNTEHEYSHSNMPMSISCYQTHDLHHCHHEVHTELFSEPVQSTSSFSKISFNIIQFIYLSILHDQESNKMDQ